MESINLSNFAKYIATGNHSSRPAVTIAEQEHHICSARPDGKSVYFGFTSANAGDTFTVRLSPMHVTTFGSYMYQMEVIAPDGSVLLLKQFRIT